MPLVPLCGAWLVGVLLGTLWPGVTPDQARVALGLALLTGAPLALLWRERRDALGGAEPAGALAGPGAQPAGAAGARGPARQPASAQRPRRRGPLGRRAAPPGARPRDRRPGTGARRGGPARCASPPSRCWWTAPGSRSRAGCSRWPGRFSPPRRAISWRPPGSCRPRPTCPASIMRSGSPATASSPTSTRAEVRVLIPADADPRNLLAQWRRDAGVRTAALLPEPEAGLLRGILLGQQKAIDRMQWRRFRWQRHVLDHRRLGVPSRILLLLAPFSGRCATCWRPGRASRWLSCWSLPMRSLSGLGVPVMRAALDGRALLVGKAAGSSGVKPESARRSRTLA